MNKPHPLTVGLKWLGGDLWLHPLRGACSLNTLIEIDRAHRARVKPSLSPMLRENKNIPRSAELERRFEACVENFGCSGELW